MPRKAGTGSTPTWSERHACYCVRANMPAVNGTPGKYKLVPILDANTHDAAGLAKARKLAPVWIGNMRRDFAAEAVVTAAAAGRPTVIAFALEWAKSKYGEDSEQFKTLNRYLAVSTLGSMLIADVEMHHVEAFVEWMKAHPSKMGGTLGSSSILTCADIVHRAFIAATTKTATRPKLIASDPFVGLPSGTLPAREDKDPAAREGWSFAWDEVSQLVYDARVPPERRVWNALAFGTGARPQSVAVLRWSDWDRKAVPLSKITVARARKRRDASEGSTKTGAVMPCPVVPPLEAILEDWFTTGWREFIGRDPKPDDLIVPNENNEMRKQGRINRFFKADCKKLGLRVRHSYVTRHAFVSNVAEDGGDSVVTDRITHEPPRSKAVNGYRRLPWNRLCSEMSKLGFPSRPHRSDAGSDAKAGRGGESPEKVRRGDWIRTNADSTRAACHDENATVSIPEHVPSSPVIATGNGERQNESQNADPIATARAAIMRAVADAALLGDLGEVRRLTDAAERLQPASAPAAPASVIPIGRGAKRG